jgi:acyl-CoA thioesterase
LTLTPQDIAEKSSAILDSGDAASRTMGIVVTQIAPGLATVTMPITPDKLNGHGICHGGLIFTLADTAFAHACNSYNQRVVAQTCSISFLAPGKANDMLTATAKEIHQAGRSGIYDIEVKSASGDIIAQFRGQSRSIKGKHFEEEPT